MRGPAQVGAAIDEALQNHVIPDDARPGGRYCAGVSGFQEYLPSAKPVEAGGRTAQPHGVAIAETKPGEHRGAGVGNQRGIEVFEAAAADEDADDERQQRRSGPTWWHVRCLRAAEAKAIDSLGSHAAAHRPRTIFG